MVNVAENHHYILSLAYPDGRQVQLTMHNPVCVEDNPA